MEIKEQMRNLLNTQKDMVKQYEEVLKEFETSDLVNENIELKKELNRCRKLVDDLNNRLQHTTKENENLRIAIREQILDEKLNILKISMKKIETYFNDASYDCKNSLVYLKQRASDRLGKLKEIAAKELDKDKEVFDQKIDTLTAEISERINNRIAGLQGLKSDMLKDLESDAGHIGSQGISEELIQKRIRQNDIEVRIGLNWINKIGILLVLIGVATAMKYTYSNFFNSYMKGISAYLTGAVFLTAGEWFNRKSKGIVAQGMTGGGIAVLYLATFSCYFILKPKIIGLETALLISVLTTLLALVLSLRYSSATIGSFALTGGYLPFFTYVFAFGFEGSGYYYAMGYLFLLNLLTLLISFYKKWYILNYLSFALNTPTLVYLAWNAPDEMVGAAYGAVTFVMYIGITLAFPFRHGKGIKIPDTILLSLNTLVSCLLIYSLFDKAHLASYNGLLALIFCIVYFSLGQLVDWLLKEEKYSRTIFYLTSYAFAILAVPFQFGIKWLAMGWLAEGVLLIIYGWRNKFRHLEIGGWIIFGLCLTAFFTIDFMNSIITHSAVTSQYFYFKYLCIMAGMLVTLFVYLRDINKDIISKYSIRGEYIKYFKCFSVINLWIYVAYMANSLYNEYVFAKHLNNSLYKSFLFVFTTMLTGYVITKIPYLYDKFVKGFAIFLYVLADLYCLGINFCMPVKVNSTALEYFSLAVLIAYNIFVFFNFRDLVLMIIGKTNKSLEIYPLALGIFLLGNLTGFLIVQFKLGGQNLLFSLLYLVFAFVFIAYGFRRKFPVLRRFGLGLSIFSTAKLFMFDLGFLKDEWRIVSYFAFGIVLIGISLIYQRFKRSMEAAPDRPASMGE